MRMFIALLIVCSVCTMAEAQWTIQASGTHARLRGLGVVGGEVAWAGGNGGTFLRTTDGGKLWRSGTVPGGSGLDIRDVDAVNANVAYLLSIGAGDLSRILKTSDGGATWSTQYVNADPEGFLDAIAFWDASRGLALGDPVRGRFVILTTDDGGRTWSPTSSEKMPPALLGEGAFAASGTCLTIGANGLAWFGTGGASVARVFRSADRGKSWTAVETPVRAGKPSAGIFSLAFHDDRLGVAVGGDHKEPGRPGSLVALTSDGGRTWRSPKGRMPGGYLSAVASVPGRQGRTLIAVGPTGSDVSRDGGEDWRRLGTTGFHAVGFASPTAGWAVGEDGLVAKFTGKGLEDR